MPRPVGTIASQASPAPLPSASLSGFDAARLSLACDQTLIASKEDTPADRDRVAASAAAGFRKMDDPLGAQLAESVAQGNSTAFVYVLAICTANGASPTP